MPEHIFTCPNCSKSMTIASATSSVRPRCMSCPKSLLSEEEFEALKKNRDSWSPEELAVVGNSVGNFLITGILGRGGMGMVYRAQHQKLGRNIALKVMRADYAKDNENTAQRFRREAKAASTLIHPNIVTLFSFGELGGGKQYLEMELVLGPSAEGLVKKRGKLDVWLSKKIIQDAAKGLALAHQHKIVHRDIKPENILLHPGGLAKVADFGLAKGYGSDETEGTLAMDLTGTGVVVGTPYFMSPEQCLGKELDGRSDIYSLGCTFYYLLTGIEPFHEETTMRVMRQHISEPIPDPTEHNPEIPKGVCKMIRKMMAKNINERYSSAEMVIKDLEALNLPARSSDTQSSDMTMEFRRIQTRKTTQRKARKSKRRNRVMIVGLVLFSLLIITILGSLVLSNGPATETKTPSPLNGASP